MVIAGILCLAIDVLNRLILRKSSPFDHLFFWAVDFSVALSAY
jgi:hypothetical protein